MFFFENKLQEMRGDKRIIKDIYLDTHKNGINKKII